MKSERSPILVAKLVERLDKAYGIEISAEETKLMTNNTRGMNKIKINGQKLETVTTWSQ